MKIRNVIFGWEKIGGIHSRSKLCICINLSLITSYQLTSVVFKTPPVVKRKANYKRYHLTIAIVFYARFLSIFSYNFSDPKMAKCVAGENVLHDGPEIVYQTWVERVRVRSSSSKSLRFLFEFEFDCEQMFEFEFEVRLFPSFFIYF